MIETVIVYFNKNKKNTMVTVKYTNPTALTKQIYKQPNKYPFKLLSFSC